MKTKKKKLEKINLGTNCLDNSKINALRKRMENLEEEKKTLINLITDELFTFAKEQYEGKVIQDGNERIKVRKIISVEPIHWGEKCYYMDISGNCLKTIEWLGNTIEIDESYIVKEGGKTITINSDGSLAYTTLVDDEDFDKRYKKVQKEFNENYRDINGMLIKSAYSRVYYVKNERVEKGVVAGFDLNKKEFILYDYDGSKFYKKGNELYLEL